MRGVGGQGLRARGLITPLGGCQNEYPLQSCGIPDEGVSLVESSQRSVDSRVAAEMRESP